METPATGSSVQQLETNYHVDVPLDRHKAVLASFMRLQELLLPSGPSLYIQSKTT